VLDVLGNLAQFGDRFLLQLFVGMRHGSLLSGAKGEV
jgi:hypothetical protein